MKKVIKTVILSFFIILTLLCLEANLDIVGFFAFNDINDNTLLLYDGYYYSQLNDIQKKIYIKIDKKAEECEERLTLGAAKRENIENDITKALMAFIYDNPQCFNIENDYRVTHLSFGILNFSVLKLHYIYDDVNVVRQMENELETAAQSILDKVIVDGMTDYEKELAIHDELAKRASYYNYSRVIDIPALNHTAYAAIVEGRTVCDGYAKAFKMLLDKANIESIIVSGETEKELHAWNMVKLDNDYYNVDITADSIEDNNKKLVVHRYFNISNDRIKLTHKFDNNFNYPESVQDKYNYYIYNDFVIDEIDNLNLKFGEIMMLQKNENALEVMVDDTRSVQSLVNSLYELNFNNMKTNHSPRINYIKIDDVYIFEK